MIEERELVSRVISGDMYAFRLLMKQHERLVLHMIGRLVKDNQEREELCQDVFLRVFEKLKDFTFQAKLSTWIATIAYRHAINYLRKHKMAFSEIPDEENVITAFVNQETPENVLEEIDTDEYVMKLVEQLPVQYKTVLTLYHLEGMSYPEICEVMNMPDGTVKSYLFRARNLLKEKVKRHLGKEELL
ncbi:MAG TPA: sigma-70 family RNA polymerase sigma factor [Chryseosolibacter sp.]|nr:sigma-70 family RNA polymerase sigma factor [Chryseosolibacter sp.]